MTYKMTPARRAALKKAQAASARKRRGKGKGKLAAANRQISKNRRSNKILKYAAIAATTGAVAYGTHRNKKKKIQEFRKNSYKIRYLPGRHFDYAGGKAVPVPESQRFTVRPSLKKKR